MTTTITDEPNSLRGRVNNLTEQQLGKLKELWIRLLETFRQQGEEWHSPSKLDSSKKTSLWGSNTNLSSKKSGTTTKSSSTKSTSDSSNLFLGTTSNPKWSSLPLEEAIVLIPGHILSSTFWNMVAGDNPDAVILRYLRARRWDLDASYKMLMNTLRWRIHMRIDDIMMLGETGVYNELESLKPGLGDQFLTNLHSYKVVLGGPDKHGRGICFATVRFHRKEDQDLEVLKIITLLLVECAQMIVHQPLETVCLIFNLEGFTLANMDFDFVKFMLICFEAYYPEILGLCLIHKAPWVFSTVWAMVTPMLDPVVASKIRFTKSVKELTEYVDLPILPPFLTDKGAFKPNNDGYKPPPPGSLNMPKSQEYLDYQTMIAEYTRHTRIWVRTNAPATDKERKQQALMLRHATINAESYLRGRTSYHDIGLAEVENGRLMLKFFGNVPAQDITDCV